MNAATRHLLGLTTLTLLFCAAWAHAGVRSQGWFGTLSPQPGDEAFQRIYIDNATLYHEDGSEVALWGVNFQSAMSWERRHYQKEAGYNPTFAEWKAITAASLGEIQLMGCDVIRIHLCPGDFADGAGNLVENEWLDMVDYTIAECYKRGIYIYFGLLNHLSYQASNVPGTFLGQAQKEQKWELTCVPEMINASVNFITQFVNRPNPYDNNRPYKHNPAWILAEIINEPIFPQTKAEALSEGGEDGVAAYEQWRIDNGKPDSTASWSEFKYASVKAFINQMDALLWEEAVPAVPVWNLFWARGPLHEGWESYDAAADSVMETVSFGTYIGKKDVNAATPPIDFTSRNLLPEVQESYDRDDWQGWPLQSRFKDNKARIVYEFNTNYNHATYLYPAMAKYFRALGVQVATMWTYNMSGVGQSDGVSSRPPHLSMEATPRKAASFLVAGEVFRDQARYETYGTISTTADAFANAALSFPLDLSAFSTDEVFIHTGSIDGSFIDIPAAPKRIVGYGDSPFVQYAGTGVYFLEAIGRGVWTLKVMPNAEPSPFSVAIDPDTGNAISLQLPGISGAFEIQSSEGLQRRVYASGETFTITPGDYVISSGGPEASTDFSVTEGYAAGALNNHVDWVAESGFMVDPPGAGGVLLADDEAWRSALNQTPLAAEADSFSVAVRFTFQRSVEALGAERMVLTLELKNSPVPNSDQIAIRLARMGANSTQYRLKFWENTGSDNSFGNSALFDEAALGFDSPADVESDELWLEFTVTRGAELTQWTAFGEIQNVTDNTQVSSFSFGPFDTHEAYFSSALYGAFGSAHSGGDSKTSQRVIHQFLAESAETPQDLSYRAWATAHFSDLPGGADHALAAFKAIRHPGSVANGIFYLFKADPNSDQREIMNRLPRVSGARLIFDYPADLPAGFAMELETSSNLEFAGDSLVRYTVDSSGNWPAPFVTTDNADGTLRIERAVDAGAKNFYRLNYVQDRPNIVLIFADDLDADEIAYTADAVHTWPTPSGAVDVVGVRVNNGDPYVYTPAIDSLADHGMLFTRFYVTATVCSSSRYSLLTGRLATAGPELQLDYAPGTHARLDWRPGVFREETSLPKALQAAGYRTGIIGKWHNMPKNVSMPRRVGADHAANATYEHTASVDASLKAYYAAHAAFLSEGFGWDVVDRMEWGNSIVNLDWQCEGALEFIEESKNEPFFLYCALPVPHGQYRFAYNDISTYDDRVSSNGILDYTPDVLPSVEDVYRRVDAQGVSRENAMALRMDDYVAAILNKLDELGLRENTLVIFTSDHGSRGKNSVYQGSAKVPMIVSWPGQVLPQSTSDSLIGSIDIAATLVELAGGNLPADMAQHSDSFVPQLFGQAEPEDWRESLLIEAGNSKAVVTRKWSYVVNRVPSWVAEAMAERPREVFWTGLDHHNYNNEKMYPEFWDADQFYDLENDLYEQQNLFSDPAYAPVVEAMQAELSEFVRELPFAFGEFGR